MIDYFVVKSIVIWVHIIVNKYVPIKLHKILYPYLWILHIDMYPYFCYDMGTETNDKQIKSGGSRYVYDKERTWKQGSGV